MAGYQIHLPETSSPGDCLGAFGTSLSAIGLELGTRINREMTKLAGNDWLSKLEDLRAQEAHQSGRPFRRSYSPYDFSWIINEPYYNQNSIIKRFLPTTAYNFFKNAKELVETRNRWYHDYNPHNVHELVKAMELCYFIAAKCNLEVLDDIEKVRKRALELKNGTYQPNERVDPEPNPTPSPAPQAQVAQAQRAVGAVWLGDLPSRKISLTESGILVDSQKQANVTTELTAVQSERYLKLWRLLLKSGWLWVDELGQVAAYVHGVLRCVGFWGEKEEPAQDPFLKFLLPRSYELHQDQVIDGETGAVLNETYLGNVTASTLKRARLDLADGELVRVTWDGDLICFGDNGPEYFGEIESKDWFAGHFFVETL